jgi:GNAT superfamily N-acetyltransferase
MDEVLETGYGPATPRGDNLCNDYAQGMADGFGALAGARGERVDEDDVATLTDGASGSLFGNVTVPRRPLRDDEWRALAERMVAFYGGRPGGGFMMMSAWPAPSPRTFGFGLVGHPPLMVRPAQPIAVEQLPGVEIRPVTDAASAYDWEHTLVHAYPEPGLQPFRAGCFLPERALAAEGWRYWVGYLDGTPVGTASAFVGPRHVDVQMISTMPQARGRGVGRALTLTATLADPALPAMLISSDLGRGVYERLGYIPLLRYTLWAGQRA